MALLVVADDLRGLYLDVYVSGGLADVLAVIDGSGGAVEFLAFEVGGFDDAGGVQLRAGGDG